MLPRRSLTHKGFTLVEIIVAASVFSLFFLGAFNLYRIGSNMFLQGSWKLQKQKEAERFLAILRERLEMASSPSVVSQTVVNEQTVHIYTLASGTEVTEPVGETRVLLFTICKPNVQPAGISGMIMPHVLTLRRNAGSKLSTLVLDGSSQIDFPGVNDDFINELNNSVGIGDFSGTPNEFGLGAATGFVTNLTEVHSLKIFAGAASGTVNADAIGMSGQTIGIEVTMRNPRHEDTTVTQSVFARINDASPIKTRLPDDL
jgi:prepilin-type N-terminal cleavage/methylation domain-containing protein